MFLAIGLFIKYRSDKTIEEENSLLESREEYNNSDIADVAGENDIADVEQINETDDETLVEQAKKVKSFSRTVYQGTSKKKLSFSSPISVEVNDRSDAERSPEGTIYYHIEAILPNGGSLNISYGDPEAGFSSLWQDSDLLTITSLVHKNSKPMVRLEQVADIPDSPKEVHQYYYVNEKVACEKDEFITADWCYTADFPGGKNLVISAVINTKMSGHAEDLDIADQIARSIEIK